jgi:hypothetical protein
MIPPVLTGIIPSRERSRRLPGVAKDPLKAIEARQEYTGWKKPNNPLKSLATLSNDDKHRSIHVVVTSLIQVDPRLDGNYPFKGEVHSAAHGKQTPSAAFGGRDGGC